MMLDPLKPTFKYFCKILIILVNILDNGVIENFIVPQCIKNEPNSKKWVNCVPEEDVPTALHLLNVIKHELHKKAVAHKCFDPTIKPQMTESEVINFCLTNFAIKDPEQIKHDLRNLFILSFNNPEWGVNVAQTEDNNGAVSEKDISKNMEQVLFNADKKVTSIIILNPQLPWKCTFYNSFLFVFNSVLFIALVFGSLYILNLGYKYYKHHIQTQKDEIGFMVERIIDILQSTLTEESNGDNFLVVNHVRDMILPVGDRQKKAGTWAKAVKFINENESRVRTEIQEVKGEPFEVWRWIGNANLSMSGDQPSFKYRQGRRLVDPEYLITEVLKFPHKLLRFCGNSNVVIKNEVREGYTSVFVLECHKCKVQHSVCSEEPESNLLSVNQAFTAGIISLGLNLYELNELSSSLRIPRISADDFNHYVEEIYEIYNESVAKDNDTSLDKLKSNFSKSNFDDSNLSYNTPNLRSSTPKLKNIENSGYEKPTLRSATKVQIDESNSVYEKPNLRSSTPKQNGINSYEDKKNAFLKQLKKTPQEIEEMSKLTINQKDDPVWFQERRKRLTASNFGRVCKLLDTTDRKKIVKDLLHSTFSGNVYTKYGNDNEMSALKDFEKMLGISVISCGLFVNQDYPFLAASPDGLIDNRGLLEIKCPYKAKDVSPEDGIRQKLIQYATFENGVFKLKKDDKYYYQVQGQLLVTGRDYCYFVVWTPLGMLYDKILKDEGFCKKMFPKLEEFYFDHVLPALLEEH